MAEEAKTGTAGAARSKFAIRGGDTMPTSELTGHLALALRLENIGVLLGAGASVPAGGKTISQLWKDLEEQKPDTVKWLKDNKYIDAADATPNIEEVPRSPCRTRHSKNSIRRCLGRRCNVHNS